MNTGSCHCGKVRFEISADLGDVRYCYCETCRKLSGAAFSVVALVPKHNFKFLGEKPELKLYKSSADKYRYYCGDCCSPIYVQVASRPDEMRIRLGLLDYEPKVNISGHMWVSEKPKWHQINDDLPQTEEF